MSDKMTKGASCFVAAWALLITTPLWLAVLWRVLTAVSADSTTWLLFYLYAAASIIGLILASIVRVSEAD